MSEAQLLQRIVSDLDFLKTKIISIEETVEDIDSDLHHVKPEYIRKLESIKKEGTISSSDFEKDERNTGKSPTLQTAPA